MEKVRPWCGQPSDRGRLKNGTEQNWYAAVAAFGCIDPERQAGIVFSRKRPELLTVTCNASGFEYQLHCTGNEWTGQRYNCSDIGQ